MHLIETVSIFMKMSNLKTLPQAQIFIVNIDTFEYEGRGMCGSPGPESSNIIKANGLKN